MDILTREELQEMFASSDGEMTVKVKLTSPDGLLNLYRWLKDKTDPIEGVECKALAFRNFDVEKETAMLTNQIVDQVASQLQQRISQLKLVTIEK